MTIPVRQDTIPIAPARVAAALSANVPTWYSSMALLACAALLGAIAGVGNMTFAVMNAVEEGMKMSSIVIFLYALLDYVKTCAGRLSFTIPAS